MAYLIEAVGTKDNRGSVVIKNGTITAPDRAIHLVDCDLKLESVKINAVNRCIGAYNTCNIVVDAESELTTTGTDVAILLYSDAGRTEAVGKLDVYGTVVANNNTEDAAWAISGNGNANRGTTVININDGAVVKCAKNSAIYHPQGGTLTVNGGIVEGQDGIYMKSGNLVVNGGVIRGVGSAETTYTYSGDGTKTPLGHGVVMEFTNYPAGIATMTKNGGVIEASNKSAIGYYVSPKCAEQDVEKLKAEKVTIR